MGGWFSCSPDWYIDTALGVRILCPKCDRFGWLHRVNGRFDVVHNLGRLEETCTFTESDDGFEDIKYVHELAEKALENLKTVYGSMANAYQEVRLKTVKVVCPVCGEVGVLNKKKVTDSNYKYFVCHKDKKCSVSRMHPEFDVLDKIYGIVNRIREVEKEKVLKLENLIKKS